MTALGTLVFFLMAITAAITALEVKDLLVAAIALSLFSLLTALLYISLGAVDVGFTEAVLGAGVTGILFVTAIIRTRRMAED